MCTRQNCLNCAAARRHKRRGDARRTAHGTLRPTSPDVRRRLLDEGVPSSDVKLVALEIERCIRFVSEGGDDIAVIRLHPWTHTILARYRDKVRTLFMSTRGGGLAR